MFNFLTKETPNSNMEQSGRPSTPSTSGKKKKKAPWITKHTVKVPVKRKFQAMPEDELTDLQPVKPVSTISDTFLCEFEAEPDFNISFDKISIERDDSQILMKDILFSERRMENPRFDDAIPVENKEEPLTIVDNLNTSSTKSPEKEVDLFPTIQPALSKKMVTEAAPAPEPEPIKPVSATATSGKDSSPRFSLAEEPITEASRELTNQPSAFRDVTPDGDTVVSYDSFMNDEEVEQEPDRGEEVIPTIEDDDEDIIGQVSDAFEEQNNIASEDLDLEDEDDELLDEEPEKKNVFYLYKSDCDYIIPSYFFGLSEQKDSQLWEREISRNSELLVKTLNDFGIKSNVTNVHRGPVITRYEIQIAAGIKVNKVSALQDDLAMALAASRVRIVAPIPGKSAVGVEIPNKMRETVTIGDLFQSQEYRNEVLKLKVGLGKDILGNTVLLDLNKQPHLLIAGATGAGKSVCVNTLISSLVYSYSPNHVRFIMVDPKMVELQLYNGLPHQLTPVITEPDVAPKALKWAIYEMERRYKLLSELHTRDVERYNQKVEKYEGKSEHTKLPYIVIIVDELADLMMVAPKEIENYITRIAQKARAVGIHLVLATQRPSVDVITGIIKANFPARIAFQVAQKTDSRTIIDQNGAETLLGKGDMLYQSPTTSFPTRIQGAFISEDEIIDMVRHAQKFGHPRYIDIESEVDKREDAESEGIDAEQDELFVEALKIVEESRKASASYLQRRLSIGYNRAARIVERMEELGYVGPAQGSKPREVLV